MDASMEMFARSVGLAPQSGGDQLWADEAGHRASNLAQLAASLAHVSRTQSDSLSGEEVARRAERLRDCYVAINEVGASADVRCDGLLQELAESLLELFAPMLGPVALKVVVEPVVLTPERRNALLLIANELVTNSLKHAFPGRRAGKLDVMFGPRAGAEAVLTILDDGVGGGERVEGGRGKTLIAGLAALLGATLERPDQDAGTAVVVRLPVGPGQSPGPIARSCLVSNRDGPVAYSRQASPENPTAEERLL